MSHSPVNPRTPRATNSLHGLCPSFTKLPCPTQINPVRKPSPCLPPGAFVPSSFIKLPCQINPPPQALPRSFTRAFLFFFFFFFGFFVFFLTIIKEYFVSFSFPPPPASPSSLSNRNRPPPPTPLASHSTHERPGKTVIRTFHASFTHLLCQIRINPLRKPSPCPSHELLVHLSFTKLRCRIQINPLRKPSPCPSPELFLHPSFTELPCH
jgi:hypothetical protein